MIPLSPASGFRHAILLIGLLMLQISVVSHIRIGGASGDLLLLVTILVGLNAGSVNGALIGFFAGLLLDTQLPWVLGLAALVYCLIGYFAGMLQSMIVRAEFWVPPLFSGILTIIGLIGFGVIGGMLGEFPLTVSVLLRESVISGIINAALALLLSRLVLWAEGDDRFVHHR